MNRNRTYDRTNGDRSKRRQLLLIQKSFTAIARLLVKSSKRGPVNYISLLSREHKASIITSLINLILMPSGALFNSLL